MKNLTCAELDALANATVFDCSKLPGPPQPQPQQPITEQELLGYWRDMPWGLWGLWGRHYDGAEPDQARNLKL